MLGILVALPEETRRMVSQRMRIGDQYPLSEQVVLIVTGMGTSAVPVIQASAASGQFTTLLSLGTGVGLSPTIGTGTLCIPDDIVCDGQTIRCHQGLQAQFIAELKQDYTIVQQRLAHTSHVLTNLREKATLFQQTGANSADMESFLIGQAAARYQLNFLAIRVILDNMHLHMPQALLKHCFPTVSTLRLIGAVLRQPILLQTLWAFAKHFKQAQKTLHSVSQIPWLHTASLLRRRE